jgi:hypothetical protein
VRAQPGFAVLLAHNPGLVGATDIPDAWHSRFPAKLEVSSNWPALAALGAPQPLVGEAMRLDRQRIAGEDGLTWTSGIAEKMDAALPPGSGGVIAVYDTDGAAAIGDALGNAARKSVAHIDGASAKELKAGLAEAQAGMAG